MIRSHEEGETLATTATSTVKIGMRGRDEGVAEAVEGLGPIPVIAVIMEEDVTDEGTIEEEEAVPGATKIVETDTITTVTIATKRRYSTTTARTMQGSSVMTTTSIITALMPLLHHRRQRNRHPITMILSGTTTEIKVPSLQTATESLRKSALVPLAECCNAVTSPIVIEMLKAKMLSPSRWCAMSSAITSPPSSRPTSSWM